RGTRDLSMLRTFLQSFKTRFVVLALVGLIGCGSEESGEETAPPEDVGGGDISVDVDPAKDGNNVPDTSGEPAEIDCEATPGAFGCACDQPSDCLGDGFCVPSRTGNNVCTNICIEDCPGGYDCRLVQLGGVDPTFLCIEKGINQCRPCDANIDCQAGGLGQPSDRCVNFGETEGSFCGTGCDDNSDCFEGYACEDALEFESGATGKQCMPTSGMCQCSPRAIEEAASTGCMRGGLCSGERTCLSSGLSECNADQPSDEVCDGYDNNCSGVIDEGFTNTDGDTQADCVDTDDDNDGIEDIEDNCPLVHNPNQTDSDMDGIGNLCDTPEVPVLSSTLPASPANENDPIVIGFAEAQSIVQLFDNPFCQGTVRASNVVQADGSFTVVVHVEDDTETTLYANAIDLAQIPSACSGTSVLYIEDSTAPDPPTGQGTAPASPGNAPNPLVNGVSEPGATIALYSSDVCDAEPLNEVVAGADGSWSVEVTASANASTSWYLTAADLAGNQSVCSADPVVYVHDDVAPDAPAIAGTAPESPSQTSTTPIIFGTSEPGSAIVIYGDPACAQPIGGDDVTNSAGLFSVAAIVPSNAATTFYAAATDAAGNLSECSDGLLYIHDDTAPGAPNITATNPPSPGLTNQPDVHGLTEAFSVVSIYVKDDCTGVAIGSAEVGADGAFVASVTVAADAESVLYAQSVDITGHVSPCSDGWAYRHDGQAPDPPLFTTVDPASPGQSTGLIVKGTSEPGATVTLYTSSDCVGESVATSLVSGQSSVFVAPVTAAANATTTYYATATDVAGNVGGCSPNGLSYTHDDMAPVAVTLSGTNPPSPASTLEPLVIGIGEALANVALYATADCSGDALGAGQIDAFGDFGVAVSVTANTTADIYGQATDAAGNVSACSAGLSYTHDDEQPTIVVFTGTDPGSPSNTSVTPMLLGTADGNATVRIYTSASCDGDVAVTTDASPVGEFAGSVTVVENSTTTFYATSEDTAGNVSPCSPQPITYVHDTNSPDAPVVVSTSPGSPNKSSVTPVVAATAEVGATVTFYGLPECQGDAVVTALAGPDSNASATVGVTANTENSLTATATDGAGNVSACSAPLVYVHDSAAPSITLTSTEPGSPSSDTSPTVIGNTESGAAVTIYQDGECDGSPIASGTANGTGGFAIDSPIGANQVTQIAATATDAAGNTSACSVFLTYDNDAAAPAPPELTGTTPTSPSTDDTTPEVAGTAEAGATITLYKSGDCTGQVAGSINATGGTFSVVVSVLPNAKATLSATATDGVGNVSGCSDPLVYIHDNTAPGPPLLTGTQPGSPGQDPTPTVSGSTEAGADVTLYFGTACGGAAAGTGVADDNGNFSITVVVSVAANEGTTMVADAIDIVGNGSPCSAPINYVHDDIAPEAPDVISTNPLSPATQRKPFVIGAAEAQSTVTFYSDAACNSSLGNGGKAAANGTYSIKLSQNLPANQTTTIYASSTDAAGNVSPCSTTFVSYTHDSDAPDAPVLSATDPDSPSNQVAAPTVYGQADGQAVTIRIYTGGSACSALEAEISPAPGGSFVWVYDGPENTRTIFWARAVDDAGNQSACSESLEYIHDTIAPTFPGNYDGPSLEATGTIDVPGLAVEWSAASDNFTSNSQIVYEVCVSTQCQDDCEPWNPSYTTDPGDLALGISGLLPNTRYFVMVKARDLATNLSTNVEVSSFKTSGRNMANDLRLGSNDTCAFLSTGTLQCLGANPGTLSDTTDIAVGSVHRCRVTTNGSLRCSGENGFGQLGTGSTAPESGEITVGGLPPITDVAVGSGHTCALTRTGQVYCWGFNEHFSVGPYDDVVSTPTAVTTSGGQTFSGAVSIIAGAEHSCVLTGDGQAFCWGFNWAGQLGGGGSSVHAHPVPVNAPVGFVALAAGTDHTCGVTADGRVFCWGLNNDGQLGLGAGSGFSESVPQEVALGPAIGIAARASHSCAALADGTAWCWGRNEAGQLGAGSDVESSKVPLAVLESIDGDQFALDQVVGIDAGTSHTCALRADGALRCWGSNGAGQLGSTGGDGSNVANPLQGISGVSHMTRISHTADHSCGVLSDGTGRCWGVNDSAQVAFPASSVEAVTVLDALAPGQVIAVETGGAHSCALVVGGDVVCWGENGDKQLGSNVAPSSAVPVTVNLAGPARSLSLGQAHSCALLVSGAVQCWGDGSLGQLGNGSTADSATPQTVTGIDGSADSALAIAAGANHTCAVVAGEGVNALRCWGDDSADQIGAAGSSSLTPQVVSLSTVPRALGLGAGHTCVVLDDATVNCIGDDSANQSAGASTMAPVRAVSGGTAHTCAVAGDHTLWCWGNNDAGQLGNPNAATPTSAAPVTTLDDTREASAGDGSGCAVTLSGLAMCWGMNPNDQLGTHTGNPTTTPAQVQCLP
ncbi:MAG: alpha-tubulin suppressor-like RCC1 family protein, partial [Myxococcota bacterium]